MISFFQAWNTDRTIISKDSVYLLLSLIIFIGNTLMAFHPKKSWNNILSKREFFFTNLEKITKNLLQGHAPNPPLNITLPTPSFHTDNKKIVAPPPSSFLPLMPSPFYQDFFSYSEGPALILKNYLCWKYVCEYNKATDKTIELVLSFNCYGHGY